MEVHFKPLAAWPAQQPATPVSRREAARFTAGYLARLDLLEAELTSVSAKDVILQAFIAKKQIRADGWPLASAIGGAPGLILSFTSNGQPREFAADHYLDWKDNLYAIAKILEALRGINRWGGASAGKQYAGFSPVLAAKPKVAVFGTRAEAARFLSEKSGIFVAADADPASVKRAYDNAAKRWHPDVAGPSAHDTFVHLCPSSGRLRGPAAKIFDMKGDQTLTIF